MDAELFKSITGLLAAAGVGGVFAALVKAQTDRDANRLAQARFRLEEEEKYEQELADRRKDEASRIASIKEDLREARANEKDWEMRYRESQQLLEDRITACRAHGYVCVETLKLNATRRAIKDTEAPRPE